eukprot:2092218-Prymnesium_polylepis.1
MCAASVSLVRGYVSACPGGAPTFLRTGSINKLAPRHNVLCTYAPPPAIHHRQLANEQRQPQRQPRSAAFKLDAFRSPEPFGSLSALSRGRLPPPPPPPREVLGPRGGSASTCPAY